jgi:hypothetical protein
MLLGFKLFSSWPTSSRQASASKWRRPARLGPFRGYYNRIRHPKPDLRRLDVAKGQTVANQEVGQ